MTENDAFNELAWRGLIEQTTTPDTAAILGSEKLVGYIGFDPTASSLHVGSLLQIVMLARLQLCGHKPMALVGGATGFVGDPSGKTEERALLSREVVETNVDGIRAQLERILGELCERPVEVVNNYDWLGQVSLLDFLRDTGKLFSVNAMLARDSVRTRLAEREQGISFTEFAYILLQAFDFLHMFDQFGCRLQLGGSDQYGNIVGGIDLIRRKRSAHAFGITSPLLTTKDGRKLGKTERGTVWLDRYRTSPYQFYQYWLRVDDCDVVKLLRMLTMRGRDEIDAMDACVQNAPHLREAQRALARDLTSLVHGRDHMIDAEEAGKALFSHSIANLSESMLLDVMSEAPSIDVVGADFEVDGVDLVDILCRAKLSKSKGAARQDVSSGGVYVNNQRVQNVAHKLRTTDALHGRFIVLRKGKKEFFLLRLLR